MEEGRTGDGCCPPEQHGPPTGTASTPLLGQKRPGQKSAMRPPDLYMGADTVGLRREAPKKRRRPTLTQCSLQSGQFCGIALLSYRSGRGGPLTLRKPTAPLSMRKIEWSTKV